MKKTMILDTNVLMYDPKSLFSFEDNDVVIPLIVLDELDKHKNGDSQSSRHARMAIRSLDELRYLGDLHEGVDIDGGGTIRVELNHQDNVPPDLDPTKADNRIVGVALALKDVSPERHTIVITKDICLRVKCNALGVESEDYNTDSVVKDVSALYMGHREIFVDDSDIDLFYRNGSLPIKNITNPLHPNEYVHLQSNSNPQHSALACFNGLMLEKIRTHKNVWGISPRNREQIYALDALFDPDIKLVTITGRAGTGKSLLSVAAAVSQMLDTNTYNKIIMTRPIVSLGKEIGFLPGPEEEKMAVWIRGLQDALEVVFSDKGKFYLDGQIEEGNIEVQALSFIRGRSIPRTFMIVDEAQLLTKHEIKTILTRVGEGSKICLLGDIEQIDTPYLSYQDSGLTCAAEAFKDEGIASHITLLKGERSELATKASELL